MKWIDGAIIAPPAVSLDTIREVEEELGVTLPADYLVVVRQYQGAAPEPAGIDLGNGFATGVQHLLHFEDEPFMSNILAARFPLEDRIPKGVIPFAHDVGNRTFCFNYRDGSDAPTVVHWSLDWGVLPLAASFTEFLTLLHD